MSVALQASRHCYAPGTQRLSEQAVARVVKRAATLAKIPGDFPSRSLRGGLITFAFDAAEPSERTRTHARHRLIDTTLGYADQGRVSSVGTRG